MPLKVHVYEHAHILLLLSLDICSRRPASCPSWRASATTMCSTSSCEGRLRYTTLYYISLVCVMLQG